MEKEEAGPLFCEAYSGTTTERSKWQLLLAAKTEGDTLAVTQLDRIVRTARQGLELIDTLHSKSVSVRILNKGILWIRVYWQAHACHALCICCD